jgi:hypothetical protein
MYIGQGVTEADVKHEAQVQQKSKSLLDVKSMLPYSIINHACV